MDLDHRRGPSRDLRYSTFDDDWAFFANLFGQALRDELTIVAHSFRRTFVALSLDIFDRWEALWIDREREEKSQVERSFNFSIGYLFKGTMERLCFSIIGT